MFDGLWGFHKALVGFFFDTLRALLAPLVGRVMVTLGVGFMSYTMLLPELVSFVQQFLDGMSSEMVALLGALHVDKALTLIFSAMGVKMGARVSAIRLGGTNAPAPTP